jgi:hypothetical protein
MKIDSPEQAVGGYFSFELPFNVPDPDGKNLWRAYGNS